MKLSAGTVGTLLFTAVAIAAFVWMAKRPAVEGNAMIFGMPAQSTTAKAEEKAPEVTAPEAESAPEAPVAPEAPAAPEVKEQAEPEKAEIATPSAPIPPVNEASTEAPINTDSAVEETKIEETAPEAIPTDSMPATDAPASPAN